MKKFYSLVAFLTISVAGYAQDVDNFEVGPYEVDYKGSGDYKFRLRKGVDLYEYFDLKKDTTIVVNEEKPVLESIHTAWQIGAELSKRLWGYGIEATQASFFGQYKQRLANSLYFNGGVSLGYQVNKCYAGKVEGYGELEANILEIGIPLSIEYAGLKQNVSTFFVLGGISPLYSTTMTQEEKNKDVGHSSGIRIDPRIEFGAYVPMGSVWGRVGMFIQKGISISDSNPDDKELKYGDRTTRVMIGGNISVVF